MPSPLKPLLACGRIVQHIMEDSEAQCQSPDSDGSTGDLEAGEDAVAAASVVSGEESAPSPVVAKQLFSEQGTPKSNSLPPGPISGQNMREAPSIFGSVVARGTVHASEDQQEASEQEVSLGELPPSKVPRSKDYNYSEYELQRNASVLENHQVRILPKHAHQSATHSLMRMRVCCRS